MENRCVAIVSSSATLMTRGLMFAKRCFALCSEPELSCQTNSCQNLLSTLAESTTSRWGLQYFNSYSSMTTQLLPHLGHHFSRGKNQFSHVCLKHFLSKSIIINIDYNIWWIQYFLTRLNIKSKKKPLKHIKKKICCCICW